MKTIDKSKLMKRAWYLVKNQGYSIGFAMSKVWKEMKEFISNKAEQAKRDLLPEIQVIVWNPNPESMQEFYNNKEYKGD